MEPSPFRRKRISGRALGDTNISGGSRRTKRRLQRRIEAYYES